MSEPDDPSEREADRIARRVVHDVGPSVSTTSSPDRNDLDPSPTPGVTRTGKRVPEPIRGVLEPQFGVDFSTVSLHTGPDVDRTAHALGARAFTLGSDVFVDSASYVPGSRPTTELLAHELTHVVQQHHGGGRYSVSSVGPIIQRQEAAQPPTGYSPPPNDPSYLSSARNDPSYLSSAISIEELLDLYATTQEQFDIGPAPLRDPPIYTRDWIRGDGEEAIRAEIRRRVASVDERRQIQLLNYIDGMHQNESDSNREDQLRDIVGAGLALTPEQRNALRDEVENRMQDALALFSRAASAVGRSVRELVNAQADAVGLVIDVFTGFAAPALARGLARLANRLPVQASSVAYRASLAALNTERTAQVFTSVANVAKESIKRNATALFGESETDAFLDSLVQSFTNGIQAFRSQRIPNMTDEELGVLAAAYDSRVATLDVYRRQLDDLVQRFQQQVLPVGRSSYDFDDYGAGGSRTRRNVYWIESGGRRRLALVRAFHSYRPGSHSVRYYFQEWISDDMRELALDRSGGSAETLSQSEVRGL